MITIDNRKLQTQRDYSIISQMYRDDFGTDYEHFELIDEVIRRLRDSNLTDRPVIDLGSGSGVVSDYLVEKGVKHIRAVDITPEFCKMISSKYKEKIDVDCEDMISYLERTKSESIGAYIANYSIIHIPDEEIDSLFKNIQRTLDSGGLFLMSCQKGTFKGMEQEPYQQQKDKRIQTDEKLELYMNYFLEEELKDRIENVGLKLLFINTFEPKIVPGGISSSKIWILGQK